MTMNNTTRVLIIDDDEIITMQVERILEKNGYAAICAHHGREGLEKAAAEKPDLIILDRRMPEMDGNETLIELKADHDIRHIPVIMLTGDQRVSDIRTSLDLGAVDYIVKPFDMDDFLTRVNKALNKQAA